MLDCISGGRLVAGFPVGTPMDTNFCYGQIPALTRDKYAESARADHEGVGHATSRSPSTASTTSCATSTAGRSRSSSPTRRSTSRAAARSRRGTSASTTTTTTRTCRSAATCAARRCSTATGSASAARDKDDSPVPGRLRPDHLRRRHRRRGRAALRRAHPVLLQPVPARLPRVRRPARATAPSRPSRPGRCSQLTRRPRAAFGKLTWKDLVEGGHVIAGSPATVRDRMKEMIKRPADRSRLLPAAHRATSPTGRPGTRPSCSPPR